MTIFCVGSVALSSSLDVLLSSKLVLFSIESCLEIALSSFLSTLQEKKNTLAFDV